MPEHCQCAFKTDHGFADACPAADGVLVCTRPKGHDGPHSACTPSEHPERVWEADADA